MRYERPDPVDLENVFALNAAFLGWLRDAGQRAAPAAGGPLRLALAALDRSQIRRLAKTPFLLMSFAEHDEAHWCELLDERRVPDLFAVAQDADERAARLLSAGLGFLWQLAKRNAYAARLVSGASLNWCERLSECTLIELLGRAAAQPVSIEPRMADSRALWNKLLGPGVSARRELRRAARVSALQMLLTECPAARYRPLASAACALPATRSRAAERSRR